LLHTIGVLGRTDVIGELVHQGRYFGILTVVADKGPREKHLRHRRSYLSGVSVSREEGGRLVGVLTGCLVGDRYLVDGDAQERLADGVDIYYVWVLFCPSL